MEISLLDCTLRDGGYLNDADFGTENISLILDKLTSGGLDFIECGFLMMDKKYKKGKTYYPFMEEINSLIPEGNTKIVLFCDALVPFSKQLQLYKGKGVSGLRAGVYHNFLTQGIDMCKEIKNKGYDVFFQAVDTLSYSRDELLKFIDAANTLGAKSFAIVDTYGSMELCDLPPLMELVEEHLDKGIALGFHAHNNKQLAVALSMQVIACAKRDVIVDCSLFGMGRGAGNPPTEILIDHVNRRYCGAYNLRDILTLLDKFLPQIQNKLRWGYTTDNFLAGIYGSHVKNISYLQQKPGVSSASLEAMLGMMDHDHLKRYDYDYLDSIFYEYERNEK